MVIYHMLFILILGGETIDIAMITFRWVVYGRSIFYHIIRGGGKNFSPHAHDYY
jgi:hypothetical protein